MKRRAIVWLAFAVLAVGCSSSHAASTGAPRPHDKGFEVVDVQLRHDDLGLLTGTAEVKNTSGHTHTAEMRFKFRQNGSQFATATGLARAVPMGQTISVDIFSTDAWNGQPVTYTFQVDHLY